MKYAWIVLVVVSIGIVFASISFTKEPHFSAGSHHPVGVLYVKIEAEKPRKFSPPDALAKEIRLFDGKIGCRTCHNVDSKGKFTLVMSNSGSRLCLGCHIK